MQQIHAQQGKDFVVRASGPSASFFRKNRRSALVDVDGIPEPPRHREDTHARQICSVGLPFVFTELRDRAALERARINMSGFKAFLIWEINSQLLHTGVYTDPSSPRRVFDRMGMCLIFALARRRR